jgi:NADH:ubiquinone oxidoreductase subunit H
LLNKWTFLKIFFQNIKIKVVYIFVLLIIILSLLRVAFYTLIERKIIRINQFRVGPNKIIFLGFVQPIFDGFKLFLKILNSPSKNNIIFYLSPVISFFVSVIF